MRRTGNCEHCGERCVLYRVVDPRTKKLAWVCQRCERQWAKARRKALGV